MMEPEPLARVPCHASKRLDFSWGIGNELFCTSIEASPSSVPAVASCVQWCDFCRRKGRGALCAISTF